MKSRMEECKCGVTKWDHSLRYYRTENTALKIRLGVEISNNNLILYKFNWQYSLFYVYFICCQPCSTSKLGCIQGQLFIYPVWSLCAILLGLHKYSEKEKKITQFSSEGVFYICISNQWDWYPYIISSVIILRKLSHTPTNNFWSLRQLMCLNPPLLDNTVGQNM